MEIDNPPKVDEEIVIKRQWMALIATFILFVLATIISVNVLGVYRYGVLGVFIPMFYIGASSIKNRISIARFRGQKGYSRDSRAILMGAIIFILGVIDIVIVLTPSLLEKIIPF